MGQVVIGMIGLGTIGTGVLKLLSGRNDLRLKTIVVKDPGKNRPGPLPYGCTLTHDAWQLVKDPEIEILVEVMGGEEPALAFVQAAINERKHVVTANKELLAKHGWELFSLARDKNVVIAFEAAVAGGIPVIYTLSKGMRAHKVHSVHGILNGTTNFILSAMDEQGMTYEVALAQAQELGLAEADPINDVEGFDAAYKLSILSTLISGQFVNPESIYREGITKISKEDIFWAKKFGYAIKLIGISSKSALTSNAYEGITVRVHPCAIPLSHPLASISSYNNGIVISCGVGEQIMLSGPGAGQMPTAAAVVGDLINLSQVLQLQDASDFLQMEILNSRASITPPGHWISPYFLRIIVKDQSESATEISSILKKNRIGISKMHEKVEAGNEKSTDSTTTIVVTQALEQASMIKVIEELASCPLVIKIANCIPILTESLIK